MFDAMARRVARAGEPFRLFFEPADLAAELRGLGFTTLDDLSGDDLNARYFQNRTDNLKMRGRVGRIMVAQT
jgi:O-methyltransferase involved in polyketide biosynthesis